MQKLIATALVFIFAFIADAFAQGTAFTYQGRLNASGTNANGNYDLRFILYNADVGGSQVGPILTNAPVSVSGGLFTVTLDFGTGAFSGAPRWLEIAVRTNGSGASYTPLSPRQPITATPYAITAGNVAAGIHTNAVTFSNSANLISGNGAGLTTLNASSLASGTVPSAALSNAWKTTGNAGTTPGTHFLGTTDNQPLELRANNQRALRLEPATATFVSGTDTVFFSNAPNVIAGASVNRVGPNVVGTVIGGGGFDGGYLNGSFLVSYSNEVSSMFGVIGGGLNNAIQTNSNSSVIGGGQDNTVQSDTQAGVVAGGGNNTIETNSTESTISGGAGNRIRYNTLRGTIAGGSGNTILPGSSLATISGGSGNSAGIYSTVPGGRDNAALGNNAFAAGSHAKANHNGTFVWADFHENNFASTAANQFLIRAAGGVGIGTNAPRHQLRISGGPLWTSAAWGGAIELDNASAIAWNANAGGNRFGIGQSSGGLYFFATGSDPGNTVNPAFYTMVLSDNAFVGIRNNNPSTYLQVVNATCNGSSWINSSDRALKENFAPVDGREVLKKVIALPIQSWNYTNDASSRHIGPIAQDFHAAFSLNGTNDTHIATVDADGVALAAIQGLNQKLEEEIAHHRAKDAEIADLKERLAGVEKLLRRLSHTEE